MYKCIYILCDFIGASDTNQYKCYTVQVSMGNVSVKWNFCMYVLCTLYIQMWLSHSDALFSTSWHFIFVFLALHCNAREHISSCALRSFGRRLYWIILCVYVCVCALLGAILSAHFYRKCLVFDKQYRSENMHSSSVWSLLLPPPPPPLLLPSSLLSLLLLIFFRYIHFRLKFNESADALLPFTNIFFFIVKEGREGSMEKIRQRPTDLVCWRERKRVNGKQKQQFFHLAFNLNWNDTKEINWYRYTVWFYGAAD